MRRVLYRVWWRPASLAGFALALLALCQPAAAFDFFAKHEVTVQFATQNGQPLPDAEVRVFAPGEPGRPALTGRTDKDGKFNFAADRDGMWTAEAHSPTEIARATIRVGKLDKDQGGLSPFLVIGVLGVLLLVALWYRFLRVRTRRPRG